MGFDLTDLKEMFIETLRETFPIISDKIEGLKRAVLYYFLCLEKLKCHGLIEKWI